MSTWELFFGVSDETRSRYPSLCTHTTIDRHGLSRVVPMKVLSLGMSRTGTQSMQTALKILGYPTSHGFDMHSNPIDCVVWMEGFEGKYFNGPIKPDRALFDQVLGHMSATTDLPANCFGPELIAAYPEAKVILTERDYDSWFNSFENALIAGCDRPWVLWLAQRFDNARSRYAIPVVWRGVMQGQFFARDSTEFRAHARQVFDDHYAEIRSLLKDQPDRLLEYRLGDGWEPLCKLLGKEVPDVPFPWINESAHHDEMLRVIYIDLARRLVGLFLGVAGPMAGVFWAWRWMQRK